MTRKLLQQNIAKAVAVLVVPFLLLACNSPGGSLPMSNGDPSAVPGVALKQVPVNDDQSTVSAITGQAALRLNPDRGGAGKQVLIVGDHFPANSDVEIHLGGLNTGATEYVYATFQSDADGSVRGTFVMPESWPNGEKILISQVVVLATTPDFLHKSTAIFNYESGPAPTVPEITSPR